MNPRLLLCLCSFALPALALAPQTAPASAPAATEMVVAPLPGTEWSLPEPGTVLRAGPSAEHAGVLTLDGATVVRLGELRGSFRQVFVPQGFPVFMHEDYLAIKPSEATATVTGDRVNLRLLPSTEGLAPLGQLARGSGPLVLLERTGGGWARLLAPSAIPLYAPVTSVTGSDLPDARSRWDRSVLDRETRREAALESWRARDPNWQKEMELLSRTERLAEIDVTSLDAPGLAQRRAQLEEITRGATWSQTLELAGKLREDVGQVETLRAQASRALDQVQQRQAQDDAGLRREARMLGLGLRFSGRGQATARQGSVHREGLGDAPIYTLHGADGEILKLTASADIATLEALVGRHVSIEGRRLQLLNVIGPVLVIDKVVSYSR
ncbi:MAG: hypothetical protein ACT4PU_01770 [Planctomycetota bacterium]